MYRVQIEFIHSLSPIGNATIAFNFDNQQCNPSYTSILGQTGGNYEFDFHPTKIGAFDFQVMNIKGDYIQMTKLVITKIF